MILVQHVPEAVLPSKSATNGRCIWTRLRDCRVHVTIRRLDDFYRLFIAEGLEHISPVVSVKIGRLLLLLDALWCWLVAGHNVTGSVQIVAGRTRRCRRRSHVRGGGVVLDHWLFCEMNGRGMRGLRLGLLWLALGIARGCDSVAAGCLLPIPGNKTSKEPRMIRGGPRGRR